MVSMRAALSQRIEALQLAIDELLRTNRGPTTEQQLIQTLSSPPYALIDSAGLRSPLGLFQLHFLIFHSLYSLRQRDARILIHTLHIGYNRPSASDLDGRDLASEDLAPTPMSQADCIEHMQATAEPLAQYYLDLDNLFTTSSGDVQALLGNFWNAFGRHVTASSSTHREVVREHRQD